LRGWEPELEVVRQRSDFRIRELRWLSQPG